MNRPARIFIRATTRADRHQLVDDVRDAISGSGGWVLDFKQFSNFALSLVFEITARDWPGLLDRFSQLDWRLAEQPQPGVPGTADPARELSVALHLTFIHDEGDQRRPLPHIPG